MTTFYMLYIMATVVQLPGPSIMSADKAQAVLEREKYIGSSPNVGLIKQARAMYGIPARGTKRRVPDVDRFTPGRGGKKRKTRRHKKHSRKTHRR